MKAIAPALLLTACACAAAPTAPPERHHQARHHAAPPQAHRASAPVECVVGSPDPAYDGATLVLHYPRHSRRNYGFGAYMNGFPVDATPAELTAARQAARVILTRSATTAPWTLAQDASLCPGDPSIALQ